MNAIFLGAGASRGTFTADESVVPVAAEFGRILSVVRPTWRHDWPTIASAVEHLQLVPDDWALEPVWTLFDYYAKFHQFLPSKQYPVGQTSPQIKAALLAIYGRRCDELGTRVSSNSTLGRLLKSDLKNGDILVSFNYDTIAERVASSTHRLMSMAGSGDCVRLVKPHGSCSWALRPSSGAVTWCLDDGSPVMSSVREEDIANGKEPLVLGTVPIKSELVKEVQDALAPQVFKVVSNQWGMVVEALRDADTIVFVGYSFPPEDQYGRFLLGEALRLRSKPARVRYYELTALAEERAQTIKALFEGRLATLNYAGQVQDGA